MVGVRVADAIAGDLDRALADAEKATQGGTRDRRLSNQLKALAKQLETDDGDTRTGQRKAALANTLGGMATGMR